MEKKDYIYTDKKGREVHIVSLVPENPKRLLFIPPLVGASGTLAIKTFRYFFREGCLLMSFDYCGHYSGIPGMFSLENTFIDTEVALVHAIECAAKMKLPLHVAGACFGLIPLLTSLNKLQWPPAVKSLFSVSGLLDIHEILNFDDYNIFLKQRGMLFKDRADFINYITRNKDDFVNDKRLYIDVLTEYLLKVFTELSSIISSQSFGLLDYARVDFYKSFHQFITIELPEIIIPKSLPCLFFLGVHDDILNFQVEASKVEYMQKIMKLAPHARLSHIRIDHFGRGDDHYVIGKEGMSFILENESTNEIPSSLKRLS